MGRDRWRSPPQQRFLLELFRSCTMMVAIAQPCVSRSCPKVFPDNRGVVSYAWGATSSACWSRARLHATLKCACYRWCWVRAPASLSESCQQSTMMIITIRFFVKGCLPFGTGPYDAIFRLHAQGVFDMVSPCVACDFGVFARNWRVLDPCQASFMWVNSTEEHSWSFVSRTIGSDKLIKCEGPWPNIAMVAQQLTHKR